MAAKTDWANGDTVTDTALNALGTEVNGKAASSHTHAATGISDSTSTGRAVLTAADAAAARTAIGAGTSSLAVGTGGSDAKAGNYQPTAANISDATAAGRAVLTAADAAAQRTALGLAAAVTGSVNGSATALTLWKGTQAQYDAIVSKDSSTVYVVTP